MSKHKRHYLPKNYKNNPEEEVGVEDLGSLLKVTGILIQGMGTQVALLLPSADDCLEMVQLQRPTLQEWGEIIRATDDPLQFVGEPDSEGMLRKTLHRKALFQISGAVQQKIWARDNFRCVYCGRCMGAVPMTVDHFMPLELGGKNDETNYLSCCRKCNKRKGNLPPEEFCLQEEARESALRRSPGGLYRRVKQYLDEQNAKADALLAGAGRNF